MCYFLHGAVNTGINEKDHGEVSEGNYYHFNIGTKHDVKTSVLEAPGDFRITKGVCDCGTALGAHNKEHEEITELCNLLNDMCLIRDIKCVYLNKNWAGKINKSEECFHIDDVDLAEFFAEMKENCLYRIDLYPRYF